MSPLADTLRSIIGAPDEKTASLTSAIKGARLAYSAEKAVEKNIYDTDEKIPSTRALRKALTKAIEGVKTAELSDKQKRYAAYMGVGLLGIPLLSMATAKMRGARALGGVPLSKWLPEQALHGAFWGAAPAITEEIGAALPSKTASLAGQDLRSPFMGGSKMPTYDSKSFAEKNLDMSKGKAEVGPAPLMSKLKPKGPTVQDVTARVSSSPAGSLPKIGYVMHNDPLIKFLKKEAAAKEAMVLEDNEDNTPRDKNWPDEMTTQDPTDSTFADDKGPSDLQAYLNEKFDTSKGMRRKYFDKDYKAVAGMVDKVLKK